MVKCFQVKYNSSLLELSNDKNDRVEDAGYNMECDTDIEKKKARK